MVSSRGKGADAGVGIGMGWVGRIPLIELKNPRCPFHVFLKILVPYSRISRSDKTDLMDVRHASCAIFSIFDILQFAQIIFLVDRWAQSQE